MSTSVTHEPFGDASPSSGHTTVTIQPSVPNEPVDGGRDVELQPVGAEPGVAEGDTDAGVSPATISFPVDVYLENLPDIRPPELKIAGRCVSFAADVQHSNTLSSQSTSLNERVLRRLEKQTSRDNSAAALGRTDRIPTIVFNSDFDVHVSPTPEEALPEEAGKCYYEGMVSLITKDTVLLTDVLRFSSKEKMKAWQTFVNEVKDEVTRRHKEAKAISKRRARGLLLPQGDASLQSTNDSPLDSTAASVGRGVAGPTDAPCTPLSPTTDGDVRLRISRDADDDDASNSSSRIWQMMSWVALRVLPTDWQ